MFIADTPAAGDVAVHAARSDTGLVVVSVIGPPEVQPSAMHRAAHEVAELIIDRPTRARPRSLFELPLGEGHAWHIAEDIERKPTVLERFTTFLPAWEAEATHDLMRSPATGFEPAAATALRLVSPEWPRARGAAAQAVHARYTAHGFQAAAVMGLGVEVAGEREPPRDGEPVRDAWVRFGRPYAVVAITVAEGSMPSGPWHGVPVFSACVAEPSEAAG